MIIPNQNLQSVLVKNQLFPDEGPRVIPLPLDFNVSPTWHLDMETQESQAKFSIIQTLWIDLEHATDDLIVTIRGGSQQTLQAKKGTQGYYNVLVSNPSVLDFSQPSNTTDRIVVILINVPIPGAVWGPGAGGGGGSAAPPLHAIQFNNPLGTFAGDANLMWDGTYLTDKKLALTGDAAIPNASLTLPFDVTAVIARSADVDTQGNDVEGLICIADSTTPDASVFEVDTLSSYAQWKGTAAPNKLIMLGTQSFAFVGDLFDSSVEADGSQTSNLTAGYFSSGINRGNNNPTPLARAILATVDVLNDFTGGGTGIITEAQIIYIHGGHHTIGGNPGIGRLTGLWIDDMLGGSSNFAVHSGLGLVHFGDAIEQPGVAFASLPAAPTAGMLQTVTDSNTNVWGAVIAGGGVNNVLARYNGANWTVVGK